MRIWGHVLQEHTGADVEDYTNMKGNVYHAGDVFRVNTISIVEGKMEAIV